jgi:cytidylate kinase
MVQQQRRVAEKGRVVMVGRDIGTDVYPEAQLKIYLDATPEQRALRRFNELVARGQPADFQQTLANVLLRDAIDSEREASPLRQAGDAVRIDSSDLTISEVVAQLQDLVCSRLGIEAAGG